MMKRLLAILLVCAVAGEAAGQILFFGSPNPAYDLTRAPSGAKLSAADVTGATNATCLTTELKKVGGHGPQPRSQRVTGPFYVPAGRYRLNAGVTIGYRTASGGDKPAQGGMFLGAGGTTAQLAENSFESAMGNVTRFTYVGSEGSRPTTDLFTFVGNDWVLGPFELHGFTITTTTPTTGDRDMRDTFTKCRSGLTISKPLDGYPTGSSVVSMSFMGFEKAIRIIDTPVENHCDSMQYPHITFDTCDVGMWVDNQQSVSHLFDLVQLGSYVDCVWQFVNGGGLRCRLLKCNSANCTILKIDGGAYNEGTFAYNVRLDNLADNPCLIEIADTRTSPVFAVINVEIGDSCTYTVANLVKGESPGDQIYIRCTGPAQAIADFNGQSYGADTPPFMP